MTPFQLANYLKRKFGQNVDAQQVIDYFGIILLYVDTKEFMGGYRYMRRRRVIQINQNLPEHLRRCIMWHEIGHAILHRTVNCYYMANKTRLRTSIYENEAEQFAAEMLLPAMPGYDIKDFDVQKAAAYYGVTRNLIEIKWM